MKTISILYTGRLNELNGASKVVSQFLLQKNIFEKNHIRFDGLYSIDNNLNFGRYKKGFKDYIKKIFSKTNILLRKTYIGSIISYNITWKRNAKKVVSNYIKSKKNSENLIFHDIFSCYEYIKDKNVANSNIYLVLHTDGDFWKMLLSYFTKFKDTKFIDKLNVMSDVVLKKLTNIIFVSNKSRENFKKLYPKAEKLAITITNGVEDIDSVIKYDFSSLNLITVGSVCFRKNQISIIKAIERIKDSSLKLSIVGDGDKLLECRNYVISHNLEKYVYFYGSRNDVPELLELHNVFIMGSYDEGLPIAAIEAIRASLPLILTDVGGNSELIANNGILVKPDINDIERGIRKFIENKNNLVDLSKNSRKLFETKYSANSMIQEYIALINR